MSTKFTDLEHSGRGLNNAACNAFAMVELEHHLVPAFDLEVKTAGQFVSTVAGFMHFADGQKALFQRRSKDWVVRLSQPLSDVDVICIGVAVGARGDILHDPDSRPCPRKGQSYAISDHGTMVLLLEYLRRDHGALRPSTASQVRDHAFLRPSFLSECAENSLAA